MITRRMIMLTSLVDNKRYIRLSRSCYNNSNYSTHAENFWSFEIPDRPGKPAVLVCGTKPTSLWTYPGSYTYNAFTIDTPKSGEVGRELSGGIHRFRIVWKKTLIQNQDQNRIADSGKANNDNNCDKNKNQA